MTMNNETANNATDNNAIESLSTPQLKKITLGGGCFWCTEAVFSELNGVTEVTSGYAGGDTLNPTYKDICTGKTNHAEVIEVVYDADKIELPVLLDVFFATHNPTTLNRQQNDVGTQYRSVIFYDDAKELPVIEQHIQQLQKDGVDIVTQVAPAPTFYRAEEEHQQYFAKNPFQGYCQAMIPPKLNKLNQYFQKHLS